ncbi:MAG: hypothetical protein IAG10_33690 [Planctomycetaceae bacterium]|nr:hypothetical protein [Planctomycetaceae bacterium]
MTAMTSPLVENYRDQIQRCAQTMALGYVEDVRPFLANGERIEHVKLFTDGNLDKRIDKVLDQVELLKPVFDRLEDLVSEFILEVPLVAYDTGCSDGDRFLRWLGLTQVTTPEQQDHIACQLARHEVEHVARKNRLGHVRFQELRSLTDRLKADLGTNPKLRVHLNPIRTWTTFQTTVLLGEDAIAPADVLFFACGNQIRTSAFEEAGQYFVETLASHGPLTLPDWKRLDRSVCRSEVMEFCLDAAEMGLVAFG